MYQVSFLKTGFNYAVLDGLNGFVVIYTLRGLHMPWCKFMVEADFLLLGIELRSPGLNASISTQQGISPALALIFYVLSYSCMCKFVCASRYICICTLSMETRGPPLVPSSRMPPNFWDRVSHWSRVYQFG